MVTVRLKLQYADATVVARALRRPSAGVPNPGGLIEADPKLNQLILRERRPVLRVFGRVLADIDVPTAAAEDGKSLEQRCIELWDRIAGGSTASP